MKKRLSDIFIELSAVSKAISNERQLRAAMHKYDMLFLGEKFNIIYSMELHHTLSAHFGINLSMDELLSLIPTICSSLGMQCMPMVEIGHMDNPEPDAYRIQLW